MPRKPERFLKCVYLIGFKRHHKVYVGSSMRWPYRQREHLTDLSLGKHHNRHLQRAYDKYGAKRLYIRELELFDTDDAMIEGEQKWIDHYHSADPDHGYNQVPLVIPPGTIGRIASDEERQHMSKIMKDRHQSDPRYARALQKGLKEWRATNPDIRKHDCRHSGSYTLFNPEGEPVFIENLALFCEENGLDREKMYEVATDVRLECCGWKLTLDRRHKIHKDYDLVGPDGKRYQGTSIRAFAKKHDLHYRSLTALVRGQLKTCGGFRRYDMDEKTATTHKGADHILIDPDGNEVHVNNLTAFCREHGLKVGNLRKGYRSNGWIKKGYKRASYRGKALS